MVNLIKMYDETKSDFIPFELLIDRPISSKDMKEIWNLIEKEKETNIIWNYNDLNNIIFLKLKEFGYKLIDFEVNRYNY